MASTRAKAGASRMVRLPPAMSCKATLHLAVGAQVWVLNVCCAAQTLLGACCARYSRVIFSARSTSAKFAMHVQRAPGDDLGHGQVQDAGLVGRQPAGVRSCAVGQGQVVHVCVLWPGAPAQANEKGRH